MSVSLPLITTHAALAEACARLAEHPYVTVDTEFVRETTYYSRLCLIQMANPLEGVLVDPLAEGMDLTPFFALMANPAVIKVFHSARQDLEIIWQMGGVIPAPLFDSQVAAMVCGFGEQVGYEALVAALAGGKIDKSSRFTDWAQRPLSEAQTRYASADVTHLCVVYEKLHAKIMKTGRQDWISEEMRVLLDPATYASEPQDAWRRIKARIRKPIERAALMELAEWREREAQARNVPRGRVLKDEILGELALARPRSIEDLGRMRGMPQGFERSKAGQEIIAAIERGLARPPESIPPIEEDRRGGGGNGARIQLLKVLLQAVAEHNQVAPRLIASGEDLEALLTTPDDAPSPLPAWREALFGASARRLLRGEVGLGFERGRVVVKKLGEPEKG